MLLRKNVDIWLLLFNVHAKDLRSGVGRFRVKYPPMVCRPALRFAALLAVLAFLLPLAAVAESCEDCLWGAGSPACCPPSCCPCCIHGPSVLTASWGALHPVSVNLATIPRQDTYPSSPPGEIFHVPKSSL